MRPGNNLHPSGNIRTRKATQVRTSQPAPPSTLRHHERDFIPAGRLDAPSNLLLLNPMLLSRVKMSSRSSSPYAVRALFMKLLYKATISDFAMDGLPATLREIR